MPDAPDPDALADPADSSNFAGETVQQQMRGFLERIRPIEFRPLDLSRYQPRARGKARAPAIALDAHRRPLPDDPAIHRAALAYLSDMTLLDTVLVAHGYSIASGKFQIASLDHALWFHRPFRADEWLLYVQDSPSAEGARGLTRGLLYTRAGALVASVAQEGLVRRRRPTAET